MSAPELFQILLPLYDNDGGAFPQKMFDEVRAELTDRFGGATAYVRSPAVGEWKKGSEVQRDDVLMIEVVVERPADDFFRNYKEVLRKRFRQEELLVRALPLRLL